MFVCLSISMSILMVVSAYPFFSSLPPPFSYFLILSFSLFIHLHLSVCSCIYPSVYSYDGLRLLFFFSLFFHLSHIDPFFLQLPRGAQLTWNDPTFFPGTDLASLLSPSDPRSFLPPIDIMEDHLLSPSQFYFFIVFLPFFLARKFELIFYFFSSSWSYLP